MMQTHHFLAGGVNGPAMALTLRWTLVEANEGGGWARWCVMTVAMTLTAS